ncbi:TetR/AcrR family transcriptional regulator [Geodermatophilus sp. SYSU D00696]
MARWQEGTRGRLQEAAVGLFAAQGYGSTTTEQIAAAAGVTQRTFFRHFRDKEEVLFAEDDALLGALLQGVRSLPDDAAPVAVVRAALGSLADRLHDGREAQRRRAEVVASDPALVGRDLAKQARWIEALADVLAARDLPLGRARALAGAGAAAFRTAYRAWLTGPARPGLARRVERALDELAEDLAGRSPGAPAE